MLVDIEGNVVTKPFVKKGEINISPTDDMRVLRDGRVVWASINAAGNLSVNYLATPALVKNINTNPTGEDKMLRFFRTTSTINNFNSESFIQMSLKTTKNQIKKKFLLK